jgi:hypothetical protein
MRNEKSKWARSEQVEAEKEIMRKQQSNFILSDLDARENFVWPG